MLITKHMDNLNITSTVMSCKDETANIMYDTYPATTREL